MVISEASDEFLQKCEWCGKTEISKTWSGKIGLYCSFRCSAAGSYRMYVGVSVIVSMITFMLVLIGIMMQLGLSTNQPIALDLIFPMVALIGLNLSFIYGTYVGRSMRIERQTSQLNEQSTQ